MKQFQPCPRDQKNATEEQSSTTVVILAETTLECGCDVTGTFCRLFKLLPNQRKVEQNGSNTPKQQQYFRRAVASEVLHSPPRGFYQGTKNQLGYASCGLHLPPRESCAQRLSNSAGAQCRQGRQPYKKPSLGSPLCTARTPTSGSTRGARYSLLQNHLHHTSYSNTANALLKHSDNMAPSNTL